MLTTIAMTYMQWRDAWHNSLHRRKRGCQLRFMGCLIFLFVLFVTLFGCGLASVTQVRAAELYTPSKPFAILLLIDNSLSLYDLNGIGSDPDGLRFEAARLFISYLGVDDEAIPHTAGVILFGTTAELTVDWSPLQTDYQREALLSHLRNLEPLGWTDHLAALTLAQQTISHAPVDAQPVIVLLTDGKPELEAGFEPMGYRQELLALGRQLAEEDIPVFTILLTNDATADDVSITAVWQAVWQKLSTGHPSGKFYTAATANDLLSIYHDIGVRLTGGENQGAILDEAPVTNSRPLRQTLPLTTPIEKLTLVVRKSAPDLNLIIRRPSGAALRPNQTNVRVTHESLAEIWTIASPETGTWEIEIRGDGHVTVWQDTKQSTTAIPPTRTPRPTATNRPTATPTRRPTVPAPTPTPTQAIAIALLPPTAGQRAVWEPSAIDRTVTPHRPWVWWSIGGFTLFGLGVSLGGYRWWQQRQPIVDGGLRVLHSRDPSHPAGTELHLAEYATRKLTLGASPATIPLTAMEGRLTITAVWTDTQTSNITISANCPLMVNQRTLPAETKHFLQDGDHLTVEHYTWRYENLRLIPIPAASYNAAWS